MFFSSSLVLFCCVFCGWCTFHSSSSHLARGILLEFERRLIVSHIVIICMYVSMMDLMLCHPHEYFVPLSSLPLQLRVVIAYYCYYCCCTLKVHCPFC